MVISEDGYYVTTDADGRQTYYVSSEAGLKVWAEYTNQGNWGTNLTLMNNITMTKPEAHPDERHHYDYSRLRLVELDTDRKTRKFYRL